MSSARSNRYRLRLRSSELFDRPSINLGRILGGDALNKVPDTCYIDVDVRYLPEQDPDAILDEVSGIPAATIVSTFKRPPAMVDPESPFVRALCAATASHHDGEVTSVGRDGASDAVSFLRAGVPAVEFGPLGAGPSRARRVGLGRLAGELPPGDRRVRRRAAAAPGRCRRRGARMSHDDERERRRRAPPDEGDAGEHEVAAARDVGRPPARPRAEPPTPRTRSPQEEAARRTHRTTATRPQELRRDRGRPRPRAGGARGRRATSRRVRRSSASRRRGGRSEELEADEEPASEEHEAEPVSEEQDAEPASRSTRPRRRAAAFRRDRRGRDGRARRSRAGRGGGAGRAARPGRQGRGRRRAGGRRSRRRAADGRGRRPTRAASRRAPGPLWARFLAASLVIVISMAAATSISLLLYLTDIAKGLQRQRAAWPRYATS